MLDIDNRVLKTAEYIIENKCTVRTAGAHFGYSKSTVHKDMSERLKNISFEMYNDVERILQYNKCVRHIRGGEATKNKYKKIKLP